MQLSVEFSLAAILAIVLHFAASKDNPILSGILLFVLFGLCLDLPLRHLPWIVNAHPLPIKIWRVTIVVCVVVIGVGRFAIYVWPPTPKVDANRLHSVKEPTIQPRPSRIAMLRDVFPSANGTKMLLIPFRNDSTSEQTRTFHAHIAYKRTNGDEITEIPRGTWFPTGGHPESTSFPAKITRELVVFFLENEKMLRPSIKWLMQPIFGLSVASYPDLKHDEITEGIHTVEVTLLSGTYPLLFFVFELTRTADGQPILKWRK